MKSFTINSINGGVNVTFTHDDDSTHTEIIRGDAVPYNDAQALNDFLTSYAEAWEVGKALESHIVPQSVSNLAGQTINIP